MTEKMVTEQGEEHGLLNTLPNSTQDDDFKNMKPEAKAKAEKLKKEESRMVTARYVNHKEKAGKLEKAYCHWAGEPIRMYRFLNGHEYEVPVGLINEINNTFVIKRSQILDKSGVPTKGESTEKVHEFFPTKF